VAPLDRHELGRPRGVRRGRRQRPRSGDRTLARLARRLTYLTLLLVIGGVAGGVYSLARLELPDVSALADETSIVYDRNGIEIARLHGGQNRVPLDLDEMSPILIDAVIAVEDADFFTRPGVDPIAIAGAAWADIRDNGTPQGESTITQQYVRNTFLTPERTLRRKLEEAALAVKLERETSKEEILEGYLNTIYFGRGAYGVGAAARAWFGLRPSELDIGQAAYLAGLIRAPDAADISRPAQVDEAYRRRAAVLEAMLAEAFITADEWASVDATPIEGYTVPRGENASTQLSERARVSGAGFLVETIREELRERYGEQVLFRGGLRVTTSVDLDLQLEVQQIARSVLRNEDDPTTAIVVLDELGGVRALVSGNGFGESGINLVLGERGGGSDRQAGSTFKPIVLAQAVRDGISLKSRFAAPDRIELAGLDGGGTWVVRNYEERDFGIIDLTEATAQSVNTVYAQLIDEVSPEAVVALADELGVTAELQAFPSLALGAQEVSVLDMATVYSTFASRGERRDPLMILEVLDSEGVELDVFSSTAKRVLTQQQADLVTDALRGVVEGGSGITARVASLELAGKTGTSQDHRDAWFVGYSTRFTTAVWVGFADSSRPMIDVAGLDVVTGGSIPAEIWRRVMEIAHVGLGLEFFAIPERDDGVVIGADLQPTTTTTVAPTTTARVTTTAPTNQTTTSTVSAATTVPASTTTTTAQSTTTAPPGTTAPAESTSTTAADG